MYLYPLLFRISTILALPISILNSDLINAQRFLTDNDRFLSTSLRIYLTCSSSIFLGDLFWLFLLSSGNSPNILYEQRQSWFFFQTMKVSLFLYIWEALLYFDHLENSKKCFSVYLFLLGNALFLMLLCIVDIHIRIGIT